MSIKRSLIISFITAALGISLVTGGTFAYFSDTEEAGSTFAAGLLDLGLNKETIIEITNLVPGDTVNGEFELTNDGTVDMKEVNLYSSYEVIDEGLNNGGDDLGNHIFVEFVHYENGEENVLFKKRLSELTDDPTKILENFEAESNPRTFSVRFSFEDNDKNQNHFQEDSLKLKWEFEAIQGDGKENLQ
ncbi:TasA family protein [Oceanobacillus damuensis]|uniref:TasA family protein n=1 Tax=Oceanobacillus damuensis TaxID=937928 RepID=UPI00082A49CE|nr:TasA family protein [Oceanobacillus damuensis]